MSPKHGTEVVAKNRKNKNMGEIKDGQDDEGGRPRM
jgi:hypothetical protein